jgi:nucleoid-associated protein YgaU
MSRRARRGCRALAAFALSFPILLIPLVQPAAEATVVRSPATRPAPVSAPVARAVAPVSGPRLYVVAPGDSLARIAGRYLGDPARWPRIHDLNRNLLGPDDLIRPGDRLRLPADALGLPAAPRQRTHQVVAGDSLWRIAAAELGDPARWPELRRLNRGLVTDPDLVRPGWVLVLPQGGRA